jgi:oligopeptide transport system permease protein
MKTRVPLSVILSFSFLTLLVLSSMCLWGQDSGIHLRQAVQPVGAEHWMGTDALGRDLLERVLQGALFSLSMGFLCSLFSLILGLCYGAFSALAGGRLDQLMMRGLEVFTALPQMVTIGLFVIFATDKGQGASGWWGLVKLALAISLGSWMMFARLTRNLTWREKNLLYVEATRSLGASEARIFIHHIGPNILPSLLVMVGLQVPNFILFEGFLSFLGLGVQPPTPSWGLLLREGWRTMTVFPTLLLFPAGLLFLTVLSLNILFDFWRGRLLRSFAAVDTHH